MDEIDRILRSIAPRPAAKPAPTLFGEVIINAGTPEEFVYVIEPRRVCENTWAASR